VSNPKLLILGSLDPEAAAALEEKRIIEEEKKRREYEAQVRR
jgi:hypothetical protein